MFMHLLRTLIRWGLPLGLLGALVFGLFLAHEKMQAERAREAGKPEDAATPRARQDFVSLEEDQAERYGLKTEPARAVPWYPRWTIDGRIVSNPQATAEVRSPFPGTLRSVPGNAWPTLGQRIRAGQPLGRVDVRVGPEVRLDLQNKLAEARLRQQGAEKEIKLHQSRVDSLKTVTSQQILSRGELDLALVQLAQAENQLATAKAAAELWQKALHEVERHKGDEDSPWSQTLTAPADGEVTDLAARPGASIEAGAPVLTVVDFRRPLIRLDIPPEVLAHGGPPQKVEVRVPDASLPPLGGVLGPSRSARPSPSIEVHLAGPAPRVDVASQFVGYWYEAHLPSGDQADALWRPGMQVTAELRAPEAAAQSAVRVPAGAILYHEGRPLVYVRIAPEKYERREVRLLGRQGETWALAVRQENQPGGVTAGEAVVSQGAQVLLSREFLNAAVDND